jgi:hypothetical protein
MRDFTQSTLDAHLAELAQNLTLEQAEQVRERVHQRVSSSNLDLTPAAVNGAFDLLGAIGHGLVALPDAGGVGERLGGILSALDSRSLGAANLTGTAGDALAGLVSGLSRLMGGATDLGGSAMSGIGKLFGGAGDLGSGAAGAARDLPGAVPDVGEAAGALAGFVVEALGEVLGGSW